MSKVYIYPVNDVRSKSDLDELEREVKVYWYSDRGIASLEEGDIFLIYISGEIKKIKYVCEVVGVYEEGREFELKLIKKIDDNISSLLNYENLNDHGLKGRIQSYRILNNDPELCSYISDILFKNGYIDKPFC